jgi:hypothetical protein
MLRIVFSRLGKPHIGPPNAFSFNTATMRASGSMTVERGGSKTVKKTFSRAGGMCSRCEGRGSVTDFDLAQLCTQIGLPVAEVGERLGALRRTR